MKKMMITLLMGVLAVASYAQARFDVHAGMSLANITNSEGNLKVGYTVGLGVDYPIDALWSFQTGVNITSKGAKANNDGVSAKVNPVYLDIPFLAALKMDISDGNKIVLNAGPYVGFGLGGKAKQEEAGIEISSKLFSKVGSNSESMMPRCALGLQYGVGLELSDTYLVHLTGQYGFTNMIRKSFAGDNNKNLAFLLTVGYRF